MHSINAKTHPTVTEKALCEARSISIGYAAFPKKSLQDLVNELLAQPYEKEPDQHQQHPSKGSVPGEI
jgi:hypothetical protein